ncbi:coiled-coil domain-containing protein [Natrialba asiatica]|uniref:DUF2800 family protein n=1 Tax=Natrialba asiatica (strain ATCC 700177 / DSM 12278 / JCM 9576 / FERM P-10747 / NBRC 102637 / 172P1) TaxID=29540 RepID=M0AV41_NATA1|nr:hypothetical protein [Natrialba asiatica]ELZ02546.1 hypothetical protein C481_07761 [Natrialba asiatica DSM 12278]
MPGTTSWHTLLETIAELPPDATLLTPLSRDPFQITETQDHRILVEFEHESETVPLQREQFETLLQRVQDTAGGFDLDRLPSAAEPYATTLSLHPRFELDDRAGTLTETETPTGSPLVDTDAGFESGSAAAAEHAEREEPDLPVYADALLLIDALERHDPTALDGMETAALVNLYTLLSDVQRNADALRQEVSESLLDRLHHDRQVSGQYGSIQRTARRNRSLKDDEDVLPVLEDAGIDPERVTSVDPAKVDEALAVTELAESAVYEIERSEYVRKAEVDEEEKESRLQGLKDQLTGTDEETAELQREIEALEARIDDLTSFDSGASFRSPSGGET